MAAYRAAHDQQAAVAELVLPALLSCTQRGSDPPAKPKNGEDKSVCRTASQSSWGWGAALRRRFAQLEQPRRAERDARDRAVVQIAVHRLVVGVPRHVVKACAQIPHQSRGQQADL